MKLADIANKGTASPSFSALGRAVWDETITTVFGRDTPCPFSALGRAVWDETRLFFVLTLLLKPLSVLSVEPYGMKQSAMCFPRFSETSFSALGRAVWDETPQERPKRASSSSFSALGRAVWDETAVFMWESGNTVNFQCSRSSRMG